MKCGARVADHLVEAVNGGVQESFVTEQRIEHEIRALTATAMRFGKQTDRWLAASYSINSALKVNLFLLIRCFLSVILCFTCA